MLRKFALTLSVLFIVLLIGMVVWRWPAPSYRGQNLTVDIAVPETFEILLLGDMGSGGPEQFRVAESMERYCQEHPLTAVIFLGDNFYSKGVASVDDPQWKSKFLDVYSKDCLKKVPFYALLGNHDYRGNPEAQILFTSEAPAWHMPHRFYEIAFGSRLQLVMIDSNIPDVCGIPSRCSLDFMKTALTRGSFKDRLVLGHHPIVSASSKYAKMDTRGKVLRSLLCQERASYIAGHSHHLEHRQIPDCRLDAFISGGGGADLYATRNEDPDSYFASSRHGFLILKASSTELEFTFYDTWLDKLYSYVRRN